MTHQFVIGKWACVGVRLDVRDTAAVLLFMLTAPERGLHWQLGAFGKCVALTIAITL